MYSVSKSEDFRYRRLYALFLISDILLCAFGAPLPWEGSKYALILSTFTYPLYWGYKLFALFCVLLNAIIRTGSIMYATPSLTIILLIIGLWGKRFVRTRFAIRLVSFLLLILWFCVEQCIARIPFSLPWTTISIGCIMISVLCMQPKKMRGI